MNVIVNNARIRFSENPKHFTKDITILFLHDSLGCIELWRDFPEKIKAELSCNALIYDRQGYGKSDPFTIKKRTIDYLTTEAEILGQILDQLKLDNVILFGHSDGGSIALLAAALFPHKIKAIIAEGAHVFVEKETISGIKEALHLYQTTNLKQKLTKYHGDNTEMVFNMWVNTWLSDDFQSWNIEKYLKHIQCPALIIQGEQDEYGTAAQVDAIVNQINGPAEKLMIPDIGHTPHKEATIKVIDEVRIFLSGL